MTHHRFLSLMLISGMLLTAVCHGEAVVSVERNDATSASRAFRFEDVPEPSRSDAAGEAAWAIVDGDADRNGGGVNTLHDGRLPGHEDHPSGNFFFRAGGDGGRLLADLGDVVAVKQVNTYSWHPTTRGPQVYNLYASAGTSSDFQQRPKRGTDPATHGWTLMATVDTRLCEGEPGGQYGVSVADSTDILGRYRYLLFDVFPTEPVDPFGNTFFSEIDVVVPGAPVVAAAGAEEEDRQVLQETVAAEDGKYEVTIDTTDAPDLTPWARDELAPVVKAWYPKLVAMLPSNGYQAPTHVSIVFDAGMQGVAATSGTHVRCAASWFRGQLEGEAKGAVVHELVHVVQQYGRGNKRNPNATPTPSWLVEGISDYIRWFLYEPESHGADITAGNIGRAKYDASYRITGNFLNWVSENRDKDIVRKLNEAAREGRYAPGLWQECTGHTVEELAAEWRAYLTKKLSETDARS